MKFVGVLILLLNCQWAIAANEGPQADPEPNDPPQTRVIGEVSTSGVFMQNRAAGIQIHEDGQVTTFVQSMESPQLRKEKLFLILMADVVKKLKEQTEALVQTELIDLDAGKSECMDGPSTSYLVYKNSGEPIQVGSFSGCHTWVMKGGEGSAVKSLLEQLMSISWF